jgi:hypothetical protein
MVTNYWDVKYSTISFIFLLLVAMIEPRTNELLLFPDWLMMACSNECQPSLHVAPPNMS